MIFCMSINFENKFKNSIELKLKIMDHGYSLQIYVMTKTLKLYDLLIN